MSAVLPFLLLSVALAAEWRAGLGGEINADPHGVVDLGLRRGPLSAEFLTDTLDLRWAPETDEGRSWLAARLEVGAAGLMISPWTDGAPDPDRAMMASYGGLEGGGLRYLRGGWYVGPSAWARFYWFGALDSTRVAVPDPRPVGRMDLVVGRWSEQVHGWLSLGGHLQPASEVVLAPHVNVTVISQFEGRIAPLAEVRAGWAHGQDAITATRLGGLNPYVVPLAGAAWAEWWVERYAALRTGARLDLGAVGVEALVDGAVFEGVVFDPSGTFSLGVGLGGDWQAGPWTAEVMGGWAPVIDREAGVCRGSAWLRVSRDWG